jgi:hypothetical protein
MVSPLGDVLLALPGWGRQRLAAVRPGGEPQVLVGTSEDTTLPATTFGGNVAFVIGSGDQRRIAMASLRDGRVLRRFRRAATVAWRLRRTVVRSNMRSAERSGRNRWRVASRSASRRAKM